MSGLEERLVISWATRSHMLRILEIELSNYAEPWTESRFVELLKNRAVIGMVASIGNHVLTAGKTVGFVIYLLDKKHIEVLNLAVDPSHHRLGVGWSLVQKLKSKISGKRDKILARIGEDNISGQLFAKAVGFDVIGVQREADHGTGDSYVFEFARNRKRAFHQWSQVNRISNLEDCEGSL